MKLEGYFTTVERANEAVIKLKDAGFNSCYVEYDDNNRNIQRNLVDVSSAYKLASFTLDPLETKSTPLTAVSPIINVRAGFSEIEDSNYKIVVDTRSGETSKAENIIKSVGGSFKNDIKSLGRPSQDVGELNLTFKKNGV